jgi:putative membrane protein
MTDEKPTAGDLPLTMARDRTNLSRLRTELSLDRTTLAWIRTTLTMASFGFSMVAFFRSRQIVTPNPETARLHQGAIAMGAALLSLGIVATVLAGVSHWFALRKLRGGQTGLSQWPLSVTVALLLAVLGLAGLWALFAR